MSNSPESFNYPTHILTSKTPDQAALIIPNGINQTSKLVNDSVLRWFQEYESTLQNYTLGLKGLIENGSTFVSKDNNNVNKDGFTRNWNCLLTSINTEIESNEAVRKSIKREIIGPLRDLMENDVRLSELLVNSQELQEVRQGLAVGDSNAEMQWNYKAPHIFENFENFKKYEIQLLFDSILNFFQASHDKWSKNLANNENSTNYLLGSFKLKHEMNNYLNYVTNTEFQPVTDGFFKQQLKQQQSQLNSRSQPVVDQNKKSKQSKKRNSHLNLHLNHNQPPPVSKEELDHDNNSLISSGSNTKQKKGSRLSRVGSMFSRNRNKKGSKLQPSDTIPENASISTSRNDLSKSHTRNSSIPPFDGPSSSSQPHYDHSLPPTPQPQQTPSVAPQYYTKPKAVEPTTPQLPAHTIDNDATDSPNVVKYNDTDSSDDEDVGIGASHRQSLLEKHDLAPATAPTAQEELPTNLAPPAISSNTFINNHTNGTTTSSDALLSLPRSRQSSSGKYSFEVGDDQKPIAATPRTEQSNVFEDLPERDSSKPDSSSSVYNNSIVNNNTSTSISTGPGIAIGATAAAAAAGATILGLSSHDSQSQLTQPSQLPSQKSLPIPPTPPPSRKVAHHLTDDLSSQQPIQSSQQARRITSQMFANAPAARESVIQSHPTGASTLISQDTGLSLSSKHNDIFKHFDSSKVEESYGLNSSVAEVINANFKDGNLVKSQIIGEVAFTYKPHESESTIPVDPILVNIPNSYDKLILNNTFVEKLNNDSFKINPSFIISKTLGGFKYLKAVEESQIPILIQQVWKFENHQASLMINLKLNPTYSTPIVLRNFVVSVALNSDVQVSSALSKPQGAFNRDKNRITWRYDHPLTFSGSDERLIARFVTNGIGSEHESGVQVKFEIEDSPTKLTTIYNSDNSQEIPVVRNLVSGNYSGHS
ncbi:putative regulator of actin cytoskeleton [Scheffersomyces amazonensis]|uniref:putative regulator of actin cytoskeleton n=1 Tax=Scheffersomyces amazonensis TaxID=1078765 RepID=UPI00315DBB38